MSEMMPPKLLSNPAGRYANSNITTEELMGVFPSSRRKEKKSSKCLVYTLAIFVAILFIWLVFASVTLRVGDPKIEFRSARLMQKTTNYHNVSSSSPFNVTIIARVSLTNPNLGSFHYGTSTVSVLYGTSSVRVGASKLKGATLEAKETKEMDLTIHMRFGKKALLKGDITNHIHSDILKLRSYAKLSGTVLVLKMLKKRKTIHMSCIMNLNFTSFSNQYFQC